MPVQIQLTDFTLSALRERVHELRTELAVAERFLQDAEKPGRLHDRLTAEAHADG